MALQTAGHITDVPGGVMLASARALFTVASLADGDPTDQMNWDLTLGAGGGLVHRGGSAWDNKTGATAPAAVLSAGVRTRVAGAVMFRIGMEDFISWAQFDKGLPTQMRPGVHHDLTTTLGVILRVGGR